MPDDDHSAGSQEPQPSAGEVGNSDVLGQDDIDSLLQQVAGSDKPEVTSEQQEIERDRVYLHDGRLIQDNESVRVETYDFRNPAFLGETEMRRLRLMHEDFIRYLEARFALLLRMDFNLSMTKLTTISYDQAIEEVENPSHLVLFKAKPMPGMGFLEISPRLALTIASSILGGKGQAPRLERYLTAIEIDLIEEFLIVLLQEWCSQWQVEQSYEPAIVGHEVVANVLQICEHDTVMMSLTMEAQVRGCAGRIGISVPLYMIEESVRKMQVQRKQDNQVAAKKTNPSWRKGYESIPVTGKGSIEVGEVTVREVREKWKPGTVIRLPENAMQSASLSLADIPLFRCEIGVEGQNIALNVLEKIKRQGPLWNMKK